MKELEAIRELAPKWRTAAWAWEHRQNFGKGPSECADELEALLPALDTALREKSADKATVLTMRMLRTELDSTRAELAALREPMSCTHPRACWQATTPDSVDAVVGYRCVACEALDAHDAALWNEALATFQSKSEFQFNYWLNQGHAPLGAIRMAMDTVYRALKREKRGGE